MSQRQVRRERRAIRQGLKKQGYTPENLHRIGQPTTNLLVECGDLLERARNGIVPTRQQAGELLQKITEHLESVRVA